MENSIDINRSMLNLIQISSQENIILKSIEHFYENLKEISDFISIINSRSCISIRLIEYFVTKYSKKNKISYKMQDETIFNVYQSYKQQLNLYKKMNFDPFARGIRIPYYIGSSWVITTIGQLNFFKWFISKNILDYVVKNRDLIESDINKNKKNKKEKIKNPYKTYKKVETKIIPSIQNTFIPCIKKQQNIRVTF